MANRGKNSPGQVRDAILNALSESGESLSVSEIVAGFLHQILSEAQHA